MPKQLETSEHAKKDFLKTRYYKTNILLIMEYVKKYFEENKIKLFHMIQPIMKFLLKLNFII